MSTNYTENYNLCQWEAGDKVQRVDFNADNLKIDAALTAQKNAVERAQSTANAAYSPSRKGQSATQMKNCEVALSGTTVRAMDITPFLCFKGFFTPLLANSPFIGDSSFAGISLPPSCLNPPP